jgi:nicotinate-nucleotide adenylyltransferase
LTTALGSRVFDGIPPHAFGQRIGIFGGSFNPPHAGHVLASRIAIERLALDALWWMATPGNPLKDSAGLPPLRQRMLRAATIAAHPKMAVSGAEEKLGTRYTADLIRRLRERAPQQRFVWVMGSDNLAQFHQWEKWQSIAAAVPIAVVVRPGALLAALSSRAAQTLRNYRLDEADARILADCAPPAWIVLNGRRSDASSTMIRASG